MRNVLRHEADYGTVDDWRVIKLKEGTYFKGIVRNENLPHFISSKVSIEGTEHWTIKDGVIYTVIVPGKNKEGGKK